MNKSELVNAIAAGANLSKADAKKALDVTLNAISDALKSGDKVALLGFGNLPLRNVLPVQVLILLPSSPFKLKRKK